MKKWDFYTREGKIWAISDNEGPQCICTVPVNITRIEIDEERGKQWYVALLGEPVNREVRSPAEKGSMGLALAVMAAGAWGDPKLLAQYFYDEMIERWRHLFLTAQRIKEDDDPEAASVYEGFWEWVDNNIDNFGAEYGIGDWGFVLEQDNCRAAVVWISSFAKFFADFGIREKSEREAVLRFWKKKGWLGGLKNEKFSTSALPDGRFQTRAWDKTFKRVRRVYAVCLPGPGEVDQLTSVDQSASLDWSTPQTQ